MIATARHAWMRVCDILGREGMAGLYSRIRYPKMRWKHPNAISPLSGPVLVRGGDAQVRQQIIRALQDFDIALTADSVTTAGIIIHVNPDPTDAQAIGPGDVIVIVGSAPPAPDMLATLARRGKTMLIAGLGSIASLQRSGIPLQKIFALKDDARLHEGFSRYLAAIQARPPDELDWRIFSDLRNLPQRPRICLGLAETVERRQNFLASAPQGFTIFDGVRYQPGWIGAAASYRLMSRACLDQNVEQAILCEDDIQIPADFAQRFERVQAYLGQNNWDVFSGMLSDVGPGYAITKIVRTETEVFIHLNRSVGMVFGIYNRSALQRLASWSVGTGLTIDRYLEATEGLDVVTTLPFLVGHCDALTSSVWQFQNRRYTHMIRSSQARLQKMIEDHEGA